MNWLGALVVYFLIWWLVLFTVLPWGVKTGGGEQVEGQASSAPRRPMMWRKLLATTLISAVLFAIVYFVIESDLISFRQQPSG